MTPMERDKGYLEDVQTAIIKIQRYTRSLTLETFLDNNNDVIQDAVLRNISIIGEAVSKMSNSLTQNARQAPSFRAGKDSAESQVTLLQTMG